MTQLSQSRFGCWHNFVAAAAVAMAATADAQTRLAAPPSTRTVDHVDVLHGVKVADPYRWLENETGPEVLQWVEAQNAHTRSYLDRFAEREAIVSRLKKLSSAASSTAPSVVNGRYFFYHHEGLKNHSVLYVREGGYQAEPKVLLDPNTFSADGTVALDWTKISPDGKLIAYGKSSSGDEKSTLYIKDVRSGGHLPDVIPHTRYCGIAWRKDGASFLYTRYPAPGSVPDGDENYYRKMYQHRLGDDWKSDRLVIGDLSTKEEIVEPYANSTDDWVFLSRSVDWSKNDLYFRPAGSNESFRPIAVGLDGQVDADLLYGKLFIHTNVDAPRYHIVTADPQRPTPEHWKELIPQPAQGTVITSLSIIDRKLVLSLRDNAHSRIVIYDLEGKLIDEVKLPTLGAAGGVSGEWDGTELFFSFSSFAYPPAIFRYDLRTRELECIDRMAIDVDPSRYETRQLWYASKDGTRVPMFVVHAKGLKLEGNNPTLLYGYGGFDISITPRFRKGLFVWLDRGGVYASANLRGGGEFGKEWHLAGRRDKKQNVFDDFIAAAEALVQRGYTKPNRLAIYGGSNGGLLVGACMVQRPDMFRAVVCSVPLLDMLRYHRYSIARLWIPEYGSADDSEEFKWLYAYSPYHHVKPRTRYPATLFMTATSDSRVNPLHAWKMAALVQAGSAGDRPILLRTESKAGHGQGKPLTKRIQADADRWTFLMSELGMISPSATTSN
ncbi:MAG: prolyl oligopeptidase family serine peptidase [Phycisphaerae bacterium]